MSKARKISALLFAVTVLLVLFEVSVSPPTIRGVVDPVAEARYAACYQEKDDVIHDTAFGTIDNPDVQKEFIISSRARAAAECRALFPESITAVEEPGGISLLPRFW